MPTSFERARNILGSDNVHGPQERHFKWCYTAREVALLQKIPFPEEVLRAHAHTHILVAGSSLTLLDVMHLHKALFDTQWLGDGDHKRFALLQQVEARWHLPRKRPVPGSLRRSYAKQMTLLTPGEEVPRIADVVYGATLHYLATCEQLFGGCGVRCRDVVDYPEPLGKLWRPALFADGPFYINTYLDEERKRKLGLASAWKV